MSHSISPSAAVNCLYSLNYERGFVHPFSSHHGMLSATILCRQLPFSKVHGYIISVMSRTTLHSEKFPKDSCPNDINEIIYKMKLALQGEWVSKQYKTFTSHIKVVKVLSALKYGADYILFPLLISIYNCRKPLGYTKENASVEYSKQLC